MIRQIIEKWFGLDPIPCASCEVLKEALSIERQLNSVLLQKLLDKDKPEPLSSIKEEELKPIKSQFVPWRVRQQILESEDRKQAQLMKDKQREIEELEKELYIKKELDIKNGSQNIKSSKEVR
jgi:hypothetical protein